MGKIILEAKKLQKIYGLHEENEFEALHHIDFSVEEGEFVCIMGPSGSGKSTFINNISTIDMPTAGRVYINGVEVRTMTTREIGKFRYQNLGFIFQDFNLLDTHTLFENIAMPLSLAKVRKKEIRERVIAMARQLNIEDVLKKFPYECSGGQKQRAAICRALINQPHLIVADEPTGNLDSIHSQELLKILKQANEQEHVTIIMVTHDPMIASYSSRLVYINDGTIEKILKKENLNQEDYFSQIVELNSAQSRVLLKHD